jgi:hypothetical protein
MLSTCILDFYGEKKGSSDHHLLITHNRALVTGSQALHGPTQWPVLPNRGFHCQKLT